MFDKQGVSEVQFCTTKCPQLFEFEVPNCRTCRLRSKKAILENATPNLQKMTRLCAKLGSLHADLTPSKCLYHNFVSSWQIAL